MKIKKRLDMLLVEQGYADTRTKAQAIIMSGLVYVQGQKADKPGTSYEENVDIEVRSGGCPYVSRGGLKLEKALRDFGVKPEGYVCSEEELTITVPGDAGEGNYVVSVSFANAQVPHTGGTGTLMYTIGRAAIILLAGALLLISRYSRKKQVG